MPAVALALLLAASPASPPGAPALVVPVVCAYGVDCMVQQYPDHDPGPGAKDYRCGTETYDGHDGTDIRVRTTSLMRTGVVVQAAAAGVVRGVRDGMDDVSVATLGKAAVAGRECGNGVAITHPGGWETQYCHMRKGSIHVRPGQAVAQGDALGFVGESGDAAFPHLHLTVRHDGKAVDPFAYGAAPGGCSGGVSLWKPGAQPPYRSPEVLNMGFAVTPVHDEAIEDGLPDMFEAGSETPAIVVYARLINLRERDRLTVSLKAPDGSTLATQTQPPMDHSKAQYLQFVGKRRTARWAPGLYRGVVDVTRDGRVVLHETRPLTMLER